MGQFGENQRDPRTGLPILLKEATTDGPRYMNLDGIFKTGVSASTLTSVTIAAMGLVTQVTALTSTGETLASNVVTIPFAGGTNGEDYLITAKGTDSNADDWEAQGILQVRNNVP